jgi:hypothetical protein
MPPGRPEERVDFAAKLSEPEHAALHVSGNIKRPFPNESDIERGVVDHDNAISHGSANLRNQFFECGRVNDIVRSDPMD